MPDPAQLWRLVLAGPCCRGLHIDNKAESVFMRCCRVRSLLTSTAVALLLSGSPADMKANESILSSVRS